MKNINVKVMVTVVLAFVAGVLITMGACMSYVGNLTSEYENEISSNEQTIDQLTESYNNKVVELSEAENDKTELSNQIYNILEGEEYDVTIHHGDETINYYGKKTGIFNTISKGKITIY